MERRDIRQAGWPKTARLALAVALACGLTPWGCGGDGYATTAPPQPVQCPTLDAQLAGIYQLVENGELEALAAGLSGLHDDTQAGMVVTLLRLVGVFEPGTFTALTELNGAVEASADLMLVLADVVDFIASVGPGAPYPAAFEAVNVLLYTCEGPPALTLVKTLLTDDALLQALTGVLEVLDVQTLVGGLDIDGAQGREAIKALVRNVLVAAARPSFDVEVILDLLGLLFDLEAPPYDGLADAMRSLLGPGETLQSLQSLLGCLQASDPQLTLIDMLLDVVLDETLDIMSLLDQLPSGGGQGEGGLLPAGVAAPLTAALDFLIADAPSRQALQDVLAQILTAQQTPAILGDVAALLRADLLGDLVGTLANLATRSCPERDAAQADGGTAP